MYAHNSHPAQVSNMSAGEEDHVYDEVQQPSMGQPSGGESEEDLNIPSPQRRRIDNMPTLIPVESGGVIPRDFNKISLTELMASDPRRNKTVLYLQMMKVISGGTGEQRNSPSNYSYYSKVSRSNQNGAYHRMIMCREVHSRTGKLAYIIEGKYQNDELWSKQPSVRDNGVATIGTCIAILCPLPISNLLAGDIPIVNSLGGCVVMKTPSFLPSVKLNPSLPTGMTKAFVLNEMKLDFIYSAPRRTKCSGLFCDRQNVMDTLCRNRGCGCYSMLSRRSNLAMVHAIKVKDSSNNFVFQMEDFSSNEFEKLILKAPWPVTVTKTDLDNTDAKSGYDRVLDDIARYINRSGGFTIIGWYKRGEVVDQSNRDSGNAQIDSGTVSYHITSIRPTRSSLETSNTLAEKKFDMTDYDTDVEVLSPPRSGEDDET